MTGDEEARLDADYAVILAPILPIVRRWLTPEQRKAIRHDVRRRLDELVRSWNAARRAKNGG